MWPGFAPAPLGTRACALRASAALPVKLRGGLAGDSRGSRENKVREAAAPPAGLGLAVHLPLPSKCSAFNKLFYPP